MKKRVLVGVSFALILVLLSLSPVAAHEGREVGEYVIEFGWRVEPAYTEMLNGPEILITEHDTDAPVEGLEATLQVEVGFGPATKTLGLRPASATQGHYTADLIPTRPGDYSFRLFGTIGDQEIDETFTSTDGEFSTVEPIDDLRFP
jgi:hypothetical protein